MAVPGAVLHPGRGGVSGRLCGRGRLGASDGKAITRKLTPEQEQRYQPWFGNARRLHQLITELQALSVQAVEAAEGWQAKQDP